MMGLMMANVGRETKGDYMHMQYAYLLISELGGVGFERQNFTIPAISQRAANQWGKQRAAARGVVRHQSQ